MTEEEILFIGVELKEGTANAEMIKYKNFRWSIIHLNPETFHYLLSRRFDLFGLKEAGLAIYTTELKQKS